METELVFVDVPSKSIRSNQEISMALSIDVRDIPGGHCTNVSSHVRCLLSIYDKMCFASRGHHSHAHSVYYSAHRPTMYFSSIGISLFENRPRWHLQRLLLQPQVIPWFAARRDRTVSRVVLEHLVIAGAVGLQCFLFFS
jgi:hypothetical protein